MKLNTSGFTLVEILVVIALLAVLVGITVPTTINILNSSTEKTLKIQSNEVEEAASLYFEDYCFNPISVSLTCPLKSTIDPSNNPIYDDIITLQSLIDNKYIEEISIRGNKCIGRVQYKNKNINVELICGKYELKNIKE
ncbi:MAG: prepilin-type N-terminal cleavage/methylation domain-containing protein [Bacilli bacterium]